MAEEHSGRGSRWSLKEKDSLGPKSMKVFTLPAWDHRTPGFHTLKQPCLDFLITIDLPGWNSAPVLRVLTGVWCYLVTGGLEGEESRTAYEGRTEGKRNHPSGISENPEEIFPVNIRMCWLISFYSTCYPVINIRSVVPTFWTTRALLSINNVHGAPQDLYLKRYLMERKGYNKFSNASTRTCILLISIPSLYIGNTAVHTSHIKNYCN